MTSPRTAPPARGATTATAYTAAEAHRATVGEEFIHCMRMIPPPKVAPSSMELVTRFLPIVSEIKALNRECKPIKIMRKAIKIFTEEILGKSTAEFHQAASLIGALNTEEIQGISIWIEEALGDMSPKDDDEEGSKPSLKKWVNIRKLLAQLGDDEEGPDVSSIATGASDIHVLSRDLRDGLSSIGVDQAAAIKALTDTMRAQHKASTLRDERRLFPWREQLEAQSTVVKARLQPWLDGFQGQFAKMRKKAHEAAKSRALSAPEILVTNAILATLSQMAARGVTKIPEGGELLVLLLHSLVELEDPIEANNVFILMGLPQEQQLVKGEKILASTLVQFTEWGDTDLNIARVDRPTGGGDQFGGKPRQKFRTSPPRVDGAGHWPIRDAQGNTTAALEMPVEETHAAVLKLERKIDSLLARPGEARSQRAPTPTRKDFADRRSPPRPASTPSSTKRTFERPQQTCYNCGEPNHIARDCMKPRSPSGSAVAKPAAGNSNYSCEVRTNADTLGGSCDCFSCFLFVSAPNKQCISIVSGVQPTIGAGKSRQGTHVGPWIVTAEEMEALASGEPISDRIIGAAIYCLIGDAQEKKALILSGLFMRLLEENEQAVGKQIQKRLRQHRYHKILIPIHTPNHWSVCEVNLKERKIHFMDSDPPAGVGIDLANKIAVFFSQIVPESESFLFGNCYTPRQRTGSNDCGLFTIFFITKLAQNEQISAPPPDFRKQIVNRLETELTRTGLPPRTEAQEDNICPTERDKPISGGVLTRAEHKRREQQKANRPDTAPMVLDQADPIPNENTGIFEKDPAAEVEMKYCPVDEDENEQEDQHTETITRHGLSVTKGQQENLLKKGEHLQGAIINMALATLTKNRDIGVIDSALLGGILSDNERILRAAAKNLHKFDLNLNALNVNPGKNTSHWVLLAIDKRIKTILVLDSLPGLVDEITSTRHILSWVVQETGGGWDLRGATTPKQTDMNQCGLHVIANAATISELGCPSASLGNKGVDYERIRPVILRGLREDCREDIIREVHKIRPLGEALKSQLKPPTGPKIPIRETGPAPGDLTVPTGYSTNGLPVTTWITKNEIDDTTAGLLIADSIVNATLNQLKLQLRSPIGNIPASFFTLVEEKWNTTDAEDIFRAHDILFIPVCHAIHWALLVAHRKDRIIQVFDSAPGHISTKLLHPIKATFELWSAGKPWTFEETKAFRQPPGSLQCGIHLIVNAIRVIKALPARTAGVGQGNKNLDRGREIVIDALRNKDMKRLINFAVAAQDEPEGTSKYHFQGLVEPHGHGEMNVGTLWALCPPLEDQAAELSTGITKDTAKKQIAAYKLFRESGIPTQTLLPNAITRASEQISRNKKWMASTQSGFVANLLGFLNRIPQYYQQGREINLGKNQIIKDHLRELLKIMATQANFKARPFATPEMIDQAISNLESMKIPAKANRAKLQQFLALTWITGQRPSAVIRLKKDQIREWATREEIEAGKSPKLTILWLDHKTVTTRGPYCSFTAVPPRFQELIEDMMNQESEELFPQERTAERATMAHLRRALGYGLRSLRRGALIALAKSGMSTENLMTMSGHTTVHTLMRYLQWGEWNQAAADALAQAEKLL